MAALFFVSVSSAHVRRTPARCVGRPAPVLCAVRFHHWRTEVLRARLGYPARPFRRDPSHVHGAARARLLDGWVRRHQEWKHRYHQAELRAPWLRAPFYQQAMCIHGYESVDWHEPGSPGGGLQFLLSTWLAHGGARFAPAPSMATPDQQLEVAYRVVGVDGGWHEWSTHSLCGL